MQNLTQAVNLSISDSILRNVTIEGSLIRDSSFEGATLSTKTTLRTLLAHGPFQLDALGIVTLLGATQVDRAVGALSHNRLTQHLPLMGAYVFASNQFTFPISPGITLHNITEGVVVTQFAGWFARWLLTQNTLPAGTNILLTPHDSRRANGWMSWCTSLLTGSLIHVSPMAVAIIIKDFWGLANIVALTLSVLVRMFLIRANRSGIDNLVQQANDRVSESYRELEYMTVDDQASTRSRLTRTYRCLLTFPNGSKAYLQVPATHYKSCLTQTPPIARPVLYDAVRGVGWLAFGIHVLCISASSFFIQVCTVVSLVGATVLTSYGFGRDESLYHSLFDNAMRGTIRKRFKRKEMIGNSLQATFDQVFLTSTDEADIYAAMQLDSDEERRMVQWGVFPSRNDRKWYSAYMKQKAFYRLPRHVQNERLAEQNDNFEQHRRDMKERKRAANDRGEVEIPLMAAEEEEMGDMVERGESSRPHFRLSGSTEQTH